MPESAWMDLLTRFSLARSSVSQYKHDQVNEMARVDRGPRPSRPVGENSWLVSVATEIQGLVRQTVSCVGPAERQRDQGRHAGPRGAVVPYYPALLLSHVVPVVWVGAGRKEGY